MGERDNRHYLFLRFIWANQWRHFFCLFIAPFKLDCSRACEFNWSLKWLMSEQECWPNPNCTLSWNTVWMLIIWSNWSKLWYTILKLTRATQKWRTQQNDFWHVKHTTSFIWSISQMCLRDLYASLHCRFLSANSVQVLIFVEWSPDVFSQGSASLVRISQFLSKPHHFATKSYNSLCDSIWITNYRVMLLCKCLGHLLSSAWTIPSVYDTTEGLCTLRAFLTGE